MVGLECLAFHLSDPVPTPSLSRFYLLIKAAIDLPWTASNTTADCVTGQSSILQCRRVVLQQALYTL
jgi:hypothetical protein